MLAETPEMPTQDMNYLNNERISRRKITQEQVYDAYVICGFMSYYVLSILSCQ